MNYRGMLAYRVQILAILLTLWACPTFAQWSQVQKLYQSPGEGSADDWFGSCVEVEGDVALISVFRDDVGLNVDQGSAHFYRYAAGVWSDEVSLYAPDGEAGDEFGVRTSLEGDVAAISAVWDDNGANVDQGSVYMYRRISGVWTLEQKIVAADGAANDWFGYSVSVSGNVLAVGCTYADLGVGDEGAIYVYRYNAGTWNFEQKLTAADAITGDALGSVSVDGNVLIAGARGDNISFADQGSAYIFRYNAGVWTQQQKLIAADPGASDLFGWDVSLNGNVAVIGALFDDIGGNVDQGSAYIFRYNGSVWTQEVKLTSFDGAAGDRFGRMIDIEGSVCVVGADLDDVGANPDQGGAYVYRYNGASWPLEQKMVAVDGAANDWYSQSFGLSGTALLIGSLFHDQGGNPDQGAAYAYRYGSGTWNQEQKIYQSSNAGSGDDRFGFRNHVNDDVAIVGIYRDDVGTKVNQGSAMIYRKVSGTWVEEFDLVASDGEAGDEYGFWVAVEGDIAVVGAIWDDIGANTNQGSAYVYRYNGSVWVEEQKLVASDGGANDLFGHSVAILENVIAIAAPGADGAATDSGGVYIYRYNGSTWSFEQKVVATDGATADFLGTAIALGGNVLVAGAYADDNGAVLDQGSVYVFNYNGSTWVQQQKLSASDGAGGDRLGWSVAMDGNVIVAGANLDNVGAISDQGSAYVFRYNGSTWAQEQKLTASDGAAADEFGWSCTVSGSRVVVGSYLDDNGAALNQGSGYLYRYSGGTWFQEQKLTALDGAANDWYGYSVSLHSNVLFVGAFFHDIPPNPNQGAVFVYNPDNFVSEFQDYE